MTVEKITNDLMGLSISDLNKIQNIISEIKVMKAKSGINVGDKVYIVQKTKKRLGTVTKINKTKAIVEMVVNPISGGTALYTVPFSMLQPTKEAA
tara:strand:+ start:141 stop:425 length:285 start_codon:yes stop_codon:yes gene_type:complete